MRSYLTLLVCFLAKALSAQQVAKPLAPFNTLAVSGNLQVTLVRADVAKVELDSIHLAKLKIKQTEQQLSIDVNDSLVLEKPIALTIYFTQINGIRVSDIAHLETKDTLTSPLLRLDALEMAAMRIKAKVDSIWVTTANGSKVALQGKAIKLIAELNNAARLDAIRMKTEHVVVKNNGSGTAYVHATKQIAATVTGDGSIKYMGDPKDRDVQISGSGGVHELSNEEVAAVENYSDDIRIDFDKIRIDSLEKKYLKGFKRNRGNFKHWQGLDIGAAGYMDAYGKLDFKGANRFLTLNQRKSWSLAYNFWEVNLPIYSRYLRLVTGLGFNWRYLSFDNDFRLLSAQNRLSTQPLDSSFTVTKNRITTSSLRLPLLVELNLKAFGSHVFHLALGVEGEYVYRHIYRLHYELQKVDVNVKDKSDFNVNPFRYGLTARVGLSRVTLYASYSPQSLFRDASGYKAYPFAVGINIPVY